MRGRCRRYRWKASNMRQKFQLPLPEGGVQMHPGFLVRQSNGRSNSRDLLPFWREGLSSLSTHSALLPFPLKLLLLEFCPFMAPGISHVRPKRGGSKTPSLRKCSTYYDILQAESWREGGQNALDVIYGGSHLPVQQQPSRPRVSPLLRMRSFGYF